jgi:hypothetical protein
VRALIGFDRRAPGFERADRIDLALEVALRVSQHLRRVPIVGELRVTGVHAKDLHESIVRLVGRHFAARRALLAFADDVQVWAGGPAEGSSVLAIVSASCLWTAQG